MTKQIQLRRGTSSEHLLFTGANGELTYDTTLQVVTVHDGLTPSGNYLVGAATTQGIVNKRWLGIGTDGITGEVKLVTIGDANIEGNLLLRSLDVTYRNPFGEVGQTESPNSTTITGIETNRIRVGYAVSGDAVSPGTEVVSVGVGSIVLSNNTTQAGFTTEFIFNDVKSGIASIHILDVNRGTIDTLVTTDVTIGTALSVTGSSYVVGLSTFVGVSRFEDQVIFDSSEAIQIPVGGDGDRDPTPAQGQIRFNTDSGQFEGYDGLAWGTLGGTKDVDQDTYITPESTPGADEDTLFFYTGGSLSATLSSTTGAVYNVNVGIGSTLPSSSLDIDGELEVTGISTFRDKVIFDSTNSIQLPVGSTLERDNVGFAVTGQIRYNTDLASFEGYGVGGEWGTLGGVKDVDQDTYIIAESSPGADEDRLYFYNAGTNTVSVGQTEVDLNVNLYVTNDQYTDGTNFSSQLNVSGLSTFVGVSSFVGETGVTTLRFNAFNQALSQDSAVTFKSSNSGVATSYTLTLPAEPGTFGQVLSLDDSNGTLGFSTAGLYEARYYVSALNGSDSNDGKTRPVQTIKKATQLASLSGKKEVAIFVEAGDYSEDNPIILYDDVAVIGDNLRNTIIRPQNAGKDLFRVRNGCYLTGFAMKDSIDGNGVPLATFDNAVAFDDPADTNTSRVGYAVTTAKPIIFRSPYVQNCSILSFLGANGILVDGSKVQSPNITPIAEEGENPVEGDQPEQGKSMVAAAFTMVSFGGIGWRTINDGYAQIVSCFQIFCRYGSLTQSGGYLSITNSATNFGIYALRSTGFSPNSFRFDRGRVATTGTSGGLQTLKTVGLGRSEQDLYVLRFIDDDGNDDTANFKAAPVTEEFTATAANVNILDDSITITGHQFNNQDSVIYRGDEQDVPQRVIGGLVNGNQYYVVYIDANTIKLSEDESLLNVVDLTSVTTGINTLIKNSQEFFAKEIIDRHNVYQTLTIPGTQTLTFVSGRSVQQTVAGGTAVGIAYTWNPSSRELVVSVELSNDERTNFVATGGANLTIDDHTGTPISTSIGSVAGVSTYWTVETKVDSTLASGQILSPQNLPETYRLHFHRPSIINSSSHTWEYAGSGTDYNALPQNGGKTNTAFEQVGEGGGRVYTSGTNELGDFKVGDFITAFNRTGNIIFNNTVTIGNLDSIRLSLSGGVSIEEFSIDQGLGDNEVGGPQNFRVSTQLAVRGFLENRLGNFIDKLVSTNSIPNSVVQLNSLGQINQELIPPKTVNYYKSNYDGGRTQLVNQIPAQNILSGEVVAEPTDSFVLISDTVSQYIVLDNDTIYNFNDQDEVVSVNSGGGAIGVVTAPTSSGVNTDTLSFPNVGYGATGLVRGVSLSLKDLVGGSGYDNAGIYTGVRLDTASGIGTGITAQITVSVAGTVSNVAINTGGYLFAVDDLLTLNDPSEIGGRTGGSNFTVKIGGVETRLYLALTNAQKFAGNVSLPDYFADGNAVGYSTNIGIGTTVAFTPTDISLSGDVDFANDRIVVGSGHPFDDGDPLRYVVTAGTVIDPLENNVTYYAKKVGISSIELYTTYALVTRVDFNSSGTGTHELVRAGFNTSTDQITFVAHPFTQGDPVRVTGDTPTGITTDNFYFVGSVTNNSFTLHTTRAQSLNSINGLLLNTISITNAAGSVGIMTLTEQNIEYSATVNTSSNNVDNWSLLSTNSLDASNIISGVIDPVRLGSGVANDETFLSGDSSYKKVITSIGIGTTSGFNVEGFTSVIFPPGGVGYTTYFGDFKLNLNRAATTLDAYSTLGIAQFKLSTFDVGQDGRIQIKNTAAGGDVDAATLNAQSGAYYLDVDNHTGTVKVNKGGTGLAGVAPNGSILQGNGSTYNRLTNPTFIGDVTFNAGAGSVTLAADADILFTNGTVWSGDVAGKIQFFQNSLYLQYTDDLIFRNASGSNRVTIDSLGNADYVGVVTASRFVSDVAQGTAPFTVTSTTKVTNLNADLLDDLTTSSTNVNSTVVTRDASGNFAAEDITAEGAVRTNTITAEDSSAAITIANVTGKSTFAQDVDITRNLNVASTVNINSGGINAGSGIVTATRYDGNLQRTLTLNTSGNGLTGSATFNNSGNVTFTVQSDATASNVSDAIVYRDSTGNFSAGTITASLTGAASLNVLKAGDTMTGQLINTRVNQTGNGTGQIFLNGATGNRIDWNTSGVAAPSQTTRSVGTKLVLYPAISGTQVDYAMGIQNSSMWFSVPTTSTVFRWYGNTTQMMTLTGSNLDVVGNITGSRLISDVAQGTAPLTVTSTTLVSNLNADLLDGQQGSFYLNTGTGFGGDVSGTYNAIVVANDSHTHQFANLTAKNLGSGDYSTTGDFISGRGSGGVALTINDGYGNANVTWNHQNGTPEQTGKAGRIEVNTDATSGNAYMSFELGSAAAGVSAAITPILELSDTTSSRWFAASGLTFLNVPQFNGGTSGSLAPFTVDSTFLVSNLNADLLDGQEGTYYLNYTNFTNTPTIGDGTLTVAVSGTGLSISATPTFTANQTTNKTITVTSNATSANTVSTIVARDGSGNFTAGTITANLIGTATQVSNTLTRGTYLTGSSYNGSSATTWAVDATSSNTTSKVVVRDASGNFAAGTITATLSGTATNATNITLADESADTTCFPVFATGATGNLPPKTGSNLTFNASTGALGATTFVGNLQNTLTLNTSGTGLSGSTTYNNSGAATFTVTSNATSANTVSTIVARDGSGNFNAGTVTLAGELRGPASFTIDPATVGDNTGTVVIKGNLQVDGTTTTVNSTTITVDDKNIELGSVASPSDATADAGGITLKGTTDKTFNWINSTDAWTSSEHINIASGKVYRINGTEVLNATTLGSGVVNSSLQNLGTLTSDVTIGKTSPKLILNDTNGATGSYPGIQFDTTNNQGVLLEHNEFDGELPIAGYGLVLRESPNNTQFPTTGTVSLSVLGNIYAGGTTIGTLSRVLTTADEGTGNGLDADTLDGVEGASYARSDAADTISAIHTHTARPAFNGGTSGSSSPFTVDSTFVVTNLNADLLDGVQGASYARSDAADTISAVHTHTARPAFNGGTSGSTSPFTVDSTFVVTNLNADLVDGIQGSSFLRSDAADSFSGALTGSGTISVTGTEIECGRTSGSVAMTTNDGGGNANLCFNHKDRTPDTTGSSYRIETAVDSATANMYFELSSSTTSGVQVNLSNGMTLNTTGLTVSGTVTANSDIRLKTNILDYENCLDRVLNLRPVTFNRTDLEDTEKVHLGLIAQEVEEVIPEVVGENSANGYKSVAYGNIVPALIGAIQEQQKMIEELREEVRNLKNR